MPTSEEARLETALRNAAAAGDDAAATRIAQAIRSRRANTGLEAQDVESPDPFSNIPTSINGAPLDDEMRQAILMARESEDPKVKRILAARIAGRLSAQGVIDGDSFIDNIVGSEFGAALRGFGAGLFGLGDVVSASGTFVGAKISGEDSLSFGDALEAQREFRRALEEEFPLTSGLAEVGGAFFGGGGVGLVARGAVRGGTGVVARTITKATTLQPGQRLKNIARLSGAGAVAGGITEGLTEGEPVRGAEFGAVAGPIGAGLIKGAGITFRAIKNALKDPATKGLRILAKKLGEKPEEIMRRFLEFEAVTGTPASVADIANPQAAAELRDIIAEQVGSTAIARQAAEAVTRRRGAEVAEQVTGGRVTTTQTAQKTARTRQAEIQFAKANEDTIIFDKQAVDDLLLDSDLRRALPTTLRRRLDKALDAVGEDSPVELTGLDVNDLRLALRDRARGATGADRVFGELADEVVAIASAQSPAFGRAIREFERRSLRGEGVAAGRKGLAQATEEFEAGVTKASGDVDTGAGTRVGIRSALGDRAREGAVAATKLAKTLAEDSGLVRRLRAVLPAREVDRLQQLGRLQARSAENVATLAPGIRAAEDAVLRDAVRDAVGALVVAGGNTGGAFKASVVQRILARLTPRISPRIAENLAADIFDPKKQKAVLNALRRAGLDDVEILDLFVVAVVSGQQAATAINQ